MAQHGSDTLRNDGVVGLQEAGSVSRRPASPWLNAEEAAAYLRFDMADPRKAVGALRKVAQRHGVPMYRRGRRLLFDVRDLDKWLRGSRVA